MYIPFCIFSSILFSLQRFAQKSHALPDLLFCKSCIPKNDRVGFLCPPFFHTKSRQTVDTDLFFFCLR